MLRRADNVSVEFRKSLFGEKGRVWIQIGRATHRADARVLEDAYRTVQRTQQSWPYLLTMVDERAYWWFQGRFYWENDHLSEDEVYALLVTRQQRERQRIDRAMATVAMGEVSLSRFDGHHRCGGQAASAVS